METRIWCGSANSDGNQNWHFFFSTTTKDDGVHSFHTHTHGLVLGTVLNKGRYTGISAEMSVFYPKWYDKCNILSDIFLDRYGLIYRQVVAEYQPISEMKISNISPRDTFEEFLQTHLRSFYKKVCPTSLWP